MLQSINTLLKLGMHQAALDPRSARCLLVSFCGADLAASNPAEFRSESLIRLSQYRLLGCLLPAAARFVPVSSEDVVDHLDSLEVRKSE